MRSEIEYGIDHTIKSFRPKPCFSIGQHSLNSKRFLKKECSDEYNRLNGLRKH
jgi:hypothetical protein